MFDVKKLPELDRPPTYASCDPRHPDVEVNHLPNPDARFENLSPTAGHTYEIHTTHAGLNVTSGDRQLYYIARYEAIGVADLIVYGGYDVHGPQLAKAEFIEFDKDFYIYLGGLKHPAASDLDTVRCASDGKLFHAPYYRFEARSAADRQQPKCKLYWKRTHDSKLGASRLSNRDFKLIDESDDQVVAVYTEHSLSMPGHLKGMIEWRRKLGDNIELAALTVVMAIIEKMRRNVRQGSRAVPGPGTTLR